MKLTIKRPSYKTSIIIEIDNDDLTLDAVIEKLIIPALKGMEFSEENINEVFNKTE